MLAITAQNMKFSIKDFFSKRDQTALTEQILNGKLHFLCSVCSLNYTNCFMFPTGIYLFKVNNRNTRTICEICSKLTIKTAEDVVLVALLLTLKIFDKPFCCLHC